MINKCGYVLVDNNEKIITINGLSDTFFGVTIFQSYEDADNARYIEYPKCGEGCCYTTPFLVCRVQPVVLSINITKGITNETA